MAEITREYIQSKREYLQQQITIFQGALEMLGIIEGDLFPKDALTMDDLKSLVGAAEIGEPEPVKGGA